MPQLLVSVRNLREALLAHSSGVSIIDLKEPAAGPLGNVDPALRDEIVRQLQTQSIGQRPPLLSVALGELWDHVGQAGQTTELSQLDGFSFAKIGLAYGRSLDDWRTDWLSFVHSFPPGTLPVAAAYADARAAGAPEPEEVLDFALECSLQVFLLDTWSKTQGNLFQVLSQERLEHLRQQAAGRIKFALAGSLSLECEPQLRQLQPEIVAIRGDACLAGRNSPLSAERIELWKTLVSQLSDHTAHGQS